MNINRSWEHIQAKFVGTGHSDMTKVCSLLLIAANCTNRRWTQFEWASNQHRDSIASHIGHHNILQYFAVAQASRGPRQSAILGVVQGDSIGRVRYQLLEKMLQPCGPPPEKEGDEA